MKKKNMELSDPSQTVNTSTFHKMLETFKLQIIEAEALKLKNAVLRKVIENNEWQVKYGIDKSEEDAVMNELLTRYYCEELKTRQRIEKELEVANQENERLRNMVKWGLVCGSKN